MTMITAQTPTIDLTAELVELLDFTAGVALAIRLNSSYYCGPSAKASDNVSWLSDCLHNLHLLREVAHAAHPEMALNVCDIYLTLLRAYSERDHPALPVLAQYPHHIRIERAISAVESIRTKQRQRIAEGAPVRGYSCRAECGREVDAFAAAAAGRICVTAVREVDDAMLDCDLEFATGATQEELLEILRAIPDTHVMRETLRPVPLKENSMVRDLSVI